jgi:enoyl-CoA hydratase
LAARALATKVAANAPLAVAATKRIIVESADWPKGEAFDRQNAISGPVLTSADALEGAAAFAQKRPPVWRGE